MTNFYLGFHDETPAPNFSEHSGKTIEMIKFRPKTEEELKQTPAPDKVVADKPADPKKRAND